VPELPLHFSAHHSEYRTPQAVGFVVGTVEALPIPITFTPLPKDVVLNQNVPLLSMYSLKVPLV